MRNIALFGGSFDPPHIGHETIIKELTKLDYIDEIIVIPTFLNPFKSNSFAPARLRLEWLREIFSSEKTVKVSSYEVDQKRKVPTIESVKHFLKEYDKIYLVIGADNLKNLHQWYKFDALQKLVTFIVVSRGKTEIPNNFIHLDIDIKVSSTELRAKIDKNMLSKLNAEKILQYYKEHNE